MNAPFALAAGTVAGRHHVRAGRNNQDAFAWASSAAGLVAVVCDGCGSGAHSEVGAQLGARLLVQAIAAELGPESVPEQAMDRARQRTLGHLASLAEVMAGAPSGTAAFREVIAEHFLFTVVGFALTPDRAWAFSLGDGAIAVDGVVEVLGPFAGNAPPYLGYALVADQLDLGASWDLVLRPLPAPAELRSVVVATDGAAGLDLVPFWTDPRVLANPDMARRLIWQLARARGLDDDATLLVARRAAGEERA